MLKNFHNKSGQNAIEYMLITTVAIVVFLVVLYGSSGNKDSSKGMFRQYFNQSFLSAITGIEDMANSVQFNVVSNITQRTACGGPCPPSGCRFFEGYGFSEYRYYCDGYSCQIIPTLACSGGCDSEGIFCLPE